MAIAAINDPSRLDTDPFQPGDLATIAFLRVTEPATATVTALGLAALVQAARRTRAIRDR